MIAVWLTKHGMVVNPCPDLYTLSDDVEQADAAVCFHSVLVGACRA